MNLKTIGKTVNPANWFHKDAPVHERKTYALGLTDELGKFLMFGQQGATTATGAFQLYNESSAVSIPIGMIVSAFASLDAVLELPDGKQVNEHPVLDLLRKPSPLYDKILFNETLATNYLVAGDTFLIALGGVNRPPLELQPISSKNTTANQGQGGLARNMQVSGETLAGNYVLELKKNSARYFQGGLRELKQIRGFSTKDNSLLRGQSPLVSASAEARQSVLGNKHNVSLLERGGRVSLVFSFEDDLDDDEFEAAKQRVRAQYGGAEMAGQIGVTAGSKMEINEIGVNNKDMDFAKLQRMARDAVALQYKVPIVLISTDKATFNNYSEAKMALYDDAVLPLADKIFAGLSDFLLPRYGIDASTTRITYDMDAITALAKRRNEELKLRRELNLETDNELRSEIGREPLEGGNVLRAPANMIPIATDLFTEDEPTVTRDLPPPAEPPALPPPDDDDEVE